MEEANKPGKVSEKQKELEAELLTQHIDLGQLINAEVWKRIVKKLEMDEEEGHDMWVDVEAEMKLAGQTDKAKGYPLREFLQEMKIDMQDIEGIKAIESAADRAKEQMAAAVAARAAGVGAAGMTNGGDSQPKGDRPALKTMYNKIVRALDDGNLPASAAWKLLKDSKVKLAEAERRIAQDILDAGKRQDFVQAVNGYMTVSPVVNSAAGQAVTNENCIREVTKIIEECQAAGEKWTDPDWDMTKDPNSVLYVDREQPGFDCTVAPPARYRRLTDIVADSASGTTKALGGMFGGMGGGARKKVKPVLFKGGIKAGDVVQGQIGTCFLLGALGAIASHSERLVEKLFIKWDVDVGIYSIRFNIDSEWAYVTIDDWFPVDEDGMLMYSRCCDPQEVWVQLLEKAFCKMYTCYEMCDGGISAEAINSFFGGVGGRLQITKQHKRNASSYFEAMKEARAKGWMLTTGFVQSASSSSAGKCGEAVSDNGLVAGHAYSVLKLVESEGNQLVCCRNPWGTGEWTGIWSDENNQGEWTDSMCKAVSKVWKDDGKFWMSIEDFVANSSGAEYARTFGPNWKKTTQYKRFSPSCNQAGRFDLVGTVSPEAGADTMSVVVMLMQPRVERLRMFKKHRQSGLNYKDTDYPHLQLIVVAPDGSMKANEEGKNRCVWTEMTISGGGLWRIYALYPKGDGSKYALRVYMKDGTCALRDHEDGLQPSEVDDALAGRLPPAKAEEAEATMVTANSMVRSNSIKPAGKPSEKQGTDAHKDHGDDSDSDDGNEGISAEQMAEEEELAEQGIDLGQKVTSEVWHMICKRIDIDAAEAKQVWEQVQEEFTEKGEPDTGEGYPLREFLEELQIKLEDREGVAAIEKATDDAKAQLARGEKDKVTDKDRTAMKTMYNKVVRELDTAGAPAKQGWSLVQDGKVKLSKAEQGVFTQMKKDREEKVFTKQVQDYMDKAPIVSASAGQVTAKEFCIKEVNAIIKECQDLDEKKWTDPTWDMKQNPASVLYVDKQEPGWDCTVAEPAGYKRLTDIVNSNATGATKALGGMFGGMGGGGGSKPKIKPVVFKGEVKACDIVQGQIGTCFLLGAMGAVAGISASALEKMFVKYDVDLGVYGIRFNIDNEWWYVVVDDVFPVDEEGELLYSRCHDPQEVWVPILEKAFCKLHTCYEMCDGGQAAEAINCFFGGIGGRFPVKRAHKRNPDSYFKVLKQALDKGWLLTTGFRPQANSSSVGACGEHVSDNGLVAGHAYSVLKVVDALGTQMVQCRNPWGSGEWQGYWSDANNNGEWTEEMIAATGKEFKEDGKFWMSIADFVNNTSGAEYARTFGPNWKKTTQYKRFQQGDLTATAKFDFASTKADELSFSKGDQIEIESFCSDWWFGSTTSGDLGYFPGNYMDVNDRPVARFDAVNSSGPMTIVVILAQPRAELERKFYRRKDCGLNYKDTSYSDIQLVIVGPDGSVTTKKEGKKRCLWAELQLPRKGTWRIYALSADGTGARFSLRMYTKDGDCALKEVNATFDEVEALIK